LKLERSALRPHTSTQGKLPLRRFVARLSARASSRCLGSDRSWAYQSGFAVRWVIEDQLNGLLPFTGAARTSPWIAWGPYLWADGLTPRSDGLTWACGELADDGTHPGTAGRLKVAQLLLRFFQTDPTAHEWFK